MPAHYCGCLVWRRKPSVGSQNSLRFNLGSASDSLCGYSEFVLSQFPHLLNEDNNALLCFSVNEFIVCEPLRHDSNKCPGHEEMIMYALQAWECVQQIRQKPLIK